MENWDYWHPSLHLLYSGLLLIVHVSALILFSLTTRGTSYRSEFIKFSSFTEMRNLTSSNVCTSTPVTTSYLWTSILKHILIIGINYLVISLKMRRKCQMDNQIDNEFCFYHSVFMQHPRTSHSQASIPDSVWTLKDPQSQGRHFANYMARPEGPS